MVSNKLQNNYPNLKHIVNIPNPDKIPRKSNPPFQSPHPQRQCNVIPHRFLPN